MRAGTVPFLLAIVLFGAAVGLIAFALAHGGATAGIFLIIPFVVGSSPALALGALCLFLGVFALVFAMSSSGAGEEDEDEDGADGAHGPAQGAAGASSGGRPLAAASSVPGSSSGSAPAPRSRVSYGGFLLIGPVPVVFGNRPGWLPYLVAMAAVTLLAVLVFALLWVL